MNIIPNSSGERVVVQTENKGTNIKPGSSFCIILTIPLTTTTTTTTTTEYVM